MFEHREQNECLPHNIGMGMINMKIETQNVQKDPLTMQDVLSNLLAQTQLLTEILRRYRFQISSPDTSVSPRQLAILSSWHLRPHTCIKVHVKIEAEDMIRRITDRPDGRLTRLRSASI